MIENKDTLQTEIVGADSIHVEWWNCPSCGKREDDLCVYFCEHEGRMKCLGDGKTNRYDVICDDCGALYLVKGEY